MVKKAKKLNAIFNTLILTIPSLANVGSLLLLLLLLYSILGMFLFSEVRDQTSLVYPANFSTIGWSFQTLVRCSTGEAWNNIMWDAARQKSLLFDCVENQTYEDYISNGSKAVGCGNNISALIFFSSFTIVVTFVFLNLFIAIILGGFGESSEAENLPISELEIEVFCLAWK